jgi:hypothetical protein
MMTRPTQELIAELIMRLSMERDLGESFRSRPLEEAVEQAADRLSSILKAWEVVESDIVRLRAAPTPDALDNLRIAITGKEG